MMAVSGSIPSYATFCSSANRSSGPFWLPLIVVLDLKWKETLPDEFRLLLQDVHISSAVRASFPSDNVHGWEAYVLL